MTVPTAPPPARPAVRPPPKGAGPRKAGSKAKGKAAPRAPAAPRPSLRRRLGERMRGFRMRLLPLTIFVAVLMLGVRIGDLWRVASRDARLPEFPVTLAEAPAKPPAPAGAARRTQVAAADATAPEPPPPAAAGAIPSASPAASGEPLGPVNAQEVLQALAERRAEMDRRTKELEQREALLAAAEHRIDQKLQELEAVRTDIQGLLKVGDDRQSAQLESLVKIYETMKPKDAARIFEELDMPVLLDVVQRMKESKTAPILAAMDPLKAKEVTSALVERRALPAIPQ
ncbi:MotE family protein [Azospirillum sp. ST 5-10]|uniref:MotE family protein n=1 Tax=unclassified Azospirillum TaxID=2630922 RepID=UPI003F49C8A9